MRCRTAAAGSLSLVEPSGDVGAGDGRTLRGTFSVFGEWTEIRSSVEGHFMERIAAGAFAKTIRESANKIKLLYSHGNDPAIGTQVLGTIRNLRESGDAAHYEAELYDGVPELLLSGLRSGGYGSSFRAEVVKERLKPHPGRSPHNPKGLTESTVSELRLVDVGPTSLPAYGTTTAQVRTLDTVPARQLLHDDETADWYLERQPPSWLLAIEGRT
jgi:phage head maturation protease